MESTDLTWLDFKKFFWAGGRAGGSILQERAGRSKPQKSFFIIKYLEKLFMDGSTVHVPARAPQKKLKINHTAGSVLPNE